MTKQITLSEEDQREAFEEAAGLIESEADAVGADRAQRGRSAGEVKDGEVVRVLAEAYLGTLEVDGS